MTTENKEKIMSGNAFTDAVELAYAECWRQGEQVEAIASGKVKFSGGEEGKKQARNDHWREAQGGLRVLGTLLAAQGEVDRHVFPAQPDQDLPDVQQTWIRLMQWGIRQGLATQDELDQVVEASPQHAAAMKLLGQRQNGVAAAMDSSAQA